MVRQTDHWVSHRPFEENREFETMNIERLRPTVLRVTLHAYQMATLTAAARWVVDGAEGELSPEIRDRIEDVLEHYDDALGQAASATEEDRPTEEK